MSETVAIETPNFELNEILGPPPIMRGEDANRYARLQTAIANEKNPQTITDWIFVREATDKLWQQQRYRKTAVAVVEAAYIEALASLLCLYEAPRVGLARLTRGLDDEDAAKKKAREYYSGNTSPKRLKEIDAELELHKISPEQIAAKAMELSSGRVAALIKMEANSENALRALRKENNNRLAAREKLEQASSVASAENGQ